MQVGQIEPTSGASSSFLFLFFNGNYIHSKGGLQYRRDIPAKPQQVQVEVTCPILNMGWIWVRLQPIDIPSQPNPF